MNGVVHDPQRLSPLTPTIFYILLALVDGERHGYGILQEIGRRTAGSVRIGPGTLYGSLQRMLADGLIEESTERLDSGSGNETISICVEHYRVVLAQLQHLMGAQEKEFLMANGLLSLEVATLTDKGIKRQNNQDDMASVVPQDARVMAQKGALFVVADGLGGHDKGEVASKLVVQRVSDYYYQDTSTDIGASLVQAMRQANLALCQRVEEEGRTVNSMGTTCVAAVLHGEAAYIANIGDSRVYIVREGRARLITLDHSWVAEQVRLGALTEEEARTHEKSNVITRCMGGKTDIEIDLFAEPVQDGDILVLCTNGLTDVVPDAEIAAIVTQYNSQGSVARLIACANENGGPDNITAVVAHVSLAANEAV